MATSGSYNFSLNKLQTMTRALQLINVCDITQTPTSEDLSFASDILNGMLKMWETEGIHLWKRRLAVLFLQNNQFSYSLGSIAGSDHCVSSYANTTLSAAAALAAVSITVDDASDFSIGFEIGILLNNGDLQWTTISNIVANVITIADALEDEANSGNVVFGHATTAYINRPLTILLATTIDFANNQQESMMMGIGYDEYFTIPQKNMQGRPNNYFYDKLMTGAIPNAGTLFVFPSPQPASVAMRIVYQDAIQDADNNTDDIDFPTEWTYPVMFNLGVELAYAYGKFTELQQLQPKAEQLKQILLNFDSDDENLSILPIFTNIDRNGY